MRIFTAEVRAALAQQGRAEDASRILMAIMPFVGESRAEAEDKRDLHDSLVDPLVGLSTLGAHTNADFSNLALDDGIEAVTSSGSQGNLAALKSIAAGASISIAEAGRIYGRGVMCPRLVGTAKDIADEMAEIVSSGAADGFVVSPAFLPDTFEDFVDAVVPLLQHKGMLRREYQGVTLRDHLGIAGTEPR
jgi:alkanesulfonate monooxygenase SsuD/methylene tetrahydromethanopterin reductase-like flavin-dependent oxidoreductase (luciferase family)